MVLLFLSACEISPKAQIKSASVCNLVLFTFIPFIRHCSVARKMAGCDVTHLLRARKMAAPWTVSGNTGMISLFLLCVIAAAESDEQVPLVAWASDG